MNLITFILQVLLHLLKALTYQWILSAVDIVKRFLKMLKNYGAFQKLPLPVQEDNSERCSTISNPAFHRPDPCIYSQEYLLKLGLAVTWDNPDIVLRLGGVIVPEHTLLPDTEYEIDATVWNNSYEAPVVGMRVSFAFLSFGIATTINPIGDTFINLGVKGGINHPAQARMSWRTPPTSGHYCIQVTLHWIDDANPDNNMGQNNVDVVSAHSPATFHFRLRNPTDKANLFTFQVDTYSLPELPDCPATVSNQGTRAERLRRIQARLNRNAFPIPAGWSVQITPPEVSLIAGQEIDIVAEITPPTDFTGTQPFNVNAIYAGVYAGGVSLFVTRP